MIERGLRIVSLIVTLVLMPHGSYSISGGIESLGGGAPGQTPRVFGQNIVSTEDYELALSVSPDGTRVLFTRRPKGTNQNRIFMLEFEDGRWSDPALAPFAQDCRESESNFSPDGRKVFFNSRRALPPGVETGSPLNVWVVERLKSHWGEPRVLGPPLSTIRPMYATVTNSGTVYTTGNTLRGIYKSYFSDGHYETPVRLPDEINSKNWAGHPYIAPDESYLVFDSNVDDQGTKNLYVSYRQADGGWTPAKNLTEYLDFPSGAMPHVTFDGKYFFFSSNGEIYWIDAAVLRDIQRK